MVRKYENGFSLIEVIIALAVVSASLLLYAGTAATVRLGRTTRDQVQAYRIAARQMEILRSTSFAALPASGNIIDSNLSALPAGSGSFTVADYPGTAGKLKTASVTVNWTRDGEPRIVNLQTLMSETGFNPP